MRSKPPIFFFYKGIMSPQMNHAFQTAYFYRWVILDGGLFRPEESFFSDFEVCPAPKPNYVLAAGTP